jgi:hypothetical protein
MTDVEVDIVLLATAISRVERTGGLQPAIPSFEHFHNTTTLPAPTLNDYRRSHRASGFRLPYGSIGLEMELS